MVYRFLLWFIAVAAWAQPAPPTYPGQTEGDWVVRDFAFRSGETLPELRLHYLTLGKPMRNTAGHVSNVVLIMHGTGGSGRAFLRANFCGELFGPGQPLDASTHFLIMPDAIGHGKSSKPSDGLHTKFPHYTAPPLSGLIAAQYSLWMMTSSPLLLHQANPTREKADAAVQTLRVRAAQLDANDMLYQFEASAGYNPSPHLETIKVPLFAINSADDEVNPPELGILDREIQKVPRGRYILIPTSGQTRGHGTHSLPAIWGKYLTELLEESK